MIAPSRTARVLGIAVAAACGVWSALILSGAVLSGTPRTARVLFGVITALYGVYRLVIGWTGRP